MKKGIAPRFLHFSEMFPSPPNVGKAASHLRDLLRKPFFVNEFRSYFPREYLRSTMIFGAISLVICSESLYDGWMVGWCPGLRELTLPTRLPSYRLSFTTPPPFCSVRTILPHSLITCFIQFYRDPTAFTRTEGGEDGAYL